MGILTLKASQRRSLERQLRSTRDVRVYRRTLAILGVGQGEPVADIARRLRVTRRAIYHWIGTYARHRDPLARSAVRQHADDSLARLQAGPAHDRALRDGDRSGRPRQMTDRGREVLRELLGRSPQSLGGFAADWTVPLLREYLARRLRPVFTAAEDGAVWLWDVRPKARE